MELTEGQEQFLFPPVAMEKSCEFTVYQTEYTEGHCFSNDAELTTDSRLIWSHQTELKSKPRKEQNYFKVI